MVRTVNSTTVSVGEGAAFGANGITTILGRLAACLVAILAASPVAAATPSASNKQMANVALYLMDRSQEIALARSAAPPSIATDATVLVLTRSGYETAVTGTNGFVCIVARGFSGAPDWPERWNPKIFAAGCDNPQAARTMSAIARLRTDMTIAGHTDAEILARIERALHTGEIPPLEAGAMCYMMSKAASLTDAGAHTMAHVMFYTPTKDGASWGANTTSSPVFGGIIGFSRRAMTPKPPSYLRSQFCLSALARGRTGLQL